MVWIDRIAQRLARRRLARMLACAAQPERVQARVFAQLLARGRRTAFGREHGFGAVRTPADLARAVPLRDYHGMATWWDRMRAGERDVAWPGVVRYFAISSGTTAGEKYLPVSEETIRGNKRGGFDALVPHLAAGGQLFGGKMLFLGGCTEMRREGASWIGDNTGIMTKHIPRLLRHFHSPSPEIARIPVWEQKIAAAARECANADLRMLSGVPSWIVLFGERVLAESGRASLQELWPRLQLFVHGGVAFAPYRTRMAELVGGPIRYTDTYSASEGGMLAVQDRPDDPGMLPLLDQGVYFEFVPRSELGSASPRRLGIHEVELGVDHAVVLNTDSGIWGYLVGDLVRFTSLRPLRLVFAGRIAHTLNAFGEHVSGAELDRAVLAAAEECGVQPLEFAVAAIYPTGDDPQGGHRYYVEFDGPVPDAAQFVAALDRTLCAGNEDYDTHRRFGIRSLELEALPPGCFYRWMRLRGKFGGQNKVPRVLSPELEQDFVASLAPTNR